MNPKRAAYRRLLVTVVLFVLLPSVPSAEVVPSARDPELTSLSTSAVPSSASAAAGGDIRISEVMFYPESGQPEWVEIENSGPESVSIQGYSLTDEDGNWYVIPDTVPDVPSGSFVVIVFDGAGSANDDLDFSDGSAVLHSPAGVLDIFEDDVDQVALYGGTRPGAVYLPVVMKGTGNTTFVSTADLRQMAMDTEVHPRIVSFVAWGAPPYDDASNAAATGAWDVSWMVTLSRGGGFADDFSLSVPGDTIGLLPGSPSSHPDYWTVYSNGESTPGAANLVPGTAWSNAPAETGMGSSSFALAWAGVATASGYQIQIDETPDFASPITDTIVSEPRFVPVDGLPAGEYYWRVRTLSASGRSAWSGATAVESIDLPEPSSASRATVRASNVLLWNSLLIRWQLQHKDTRLLDLDGSTECGNGRWDSAHEIDDNPCDREVGNGMPVLADTLDWNYCVRASLSMFVSYYGGELSQDRISYQIYGEGPPEGDLGRGRWPNGNQLVTAANWALDGPTVEAHSGKPAFEQIKEWIDAGRPIIANIPGHVRLIHGYVEFETDDGVVIRAVVVLDPLTREQAISYEQDPTYAVWVGPAGEDSAPNVRSDEDEVWRDSDQDGIVDFDEIHRFSGLNHLEADSDRDGVGDKQDLREYLFNNAGYYSRRPADFDRDGLRKEADPDNDNRQNGGSRDGCEDQNHNGKLDSGETSNFDPAQEMDCGPCTRMPILLAPTDGSEVNTLIPRLRWRWTSTESQVAYVFQLARDTEFRQVVHSQSSLHVGDTDDLEVYLLWSPLPEQRETYYWRVWETCGDSVGPSALVPWSFTVIPGGTVLPPPARTSPANGAMVSGTKVLFLWEQIEGARGYELHTRKVGDADWMTCYMYRSRDDGGFVYPGLYKTVDPDSTYEWTVASISDYAVGSPSSEPWRFTTPP